MDKSERLVRIAGIVYHSYNGRIDWNKVKDTYNLSEFELNYITNIVRGWNK